MKKTVIFLMVLTLFSKVFGFIRDITLSYFYGASEISDAFVISLTIPTVIFGIIAAGISTGYIPIYSKIQENEESGRGRYFTNNLINILVLLCTSFIVVALIFTEPLVKVFASGFEGETLKLAVLFTRLSIAGIYFTLIVRILSAYLNYKKQFAVPALAGLPLSIITIASIIASYLFDSLIILGIANISALLIQFLFIMFFAYKNGYRFTFVLDFKDKYIKMMAIMAIPVIIGSSVTQINKLVDRTLASQVAEGGISALNYAFTLNTSILGIFAVSISTVLFPSISKMAAKKNNTGLKESLSKALAGVVILLLPVTVGVLFFSEQIVRFLFGRGAFDQEAVMMTSEAFFFYTIGLTSMGLQLILSKTFYSLHDTKTPMVNAAIAMGLNIVLNFLLWKPFGLGGLALATSVSSIFCTILLLRSLRKKIGKLGLKSTTISFIKVALASILMGLACKGIFENLKVSTGENISLLLTIFAGICIYTILIHLLKLEDIRLLSKRLLKRL
ncbi:murein biosynthesis integral membrane protein MurJ [Sutcliffiella deserti]|uniref:murein biosynthesis integral membrane protein MurJ n=1 Tax=Sutcliffiella deserti TaxID=2875501 RepID=UPI001CC020C0|nr:murein biosynthesis integral membrane protein MurJ [Sutcliffiella deserti]